MSTPDSTTWGTGKWEQHPPAPGTPLQRQQQAQTIQNLRNTASYTPDDEYHRDLAAKGMSCLVDHQRPIDPDYQPTTNERLTELEHQLNQIDRNLNSLLQGLKTITNILTPK